MPFKVFDRVSLSRGELEKAMNQMQLDGFAVIQVVAVPTTSAYDGHYTVVTTEVPGFKEHQEQIKKEALNAAAKEEEKLNGNS